MSLVSTADVMNKWKSYEEITQGLTEFFAEGSPLSCQVSISWLGGCNVTFSGCKGTIHADAVMRNIQKIHNAMILRPLKSNKYNFKEDQNNAISTIKKLNDKVTQIISKSSCLWRIVTFIRECIQRIFLCYNRHNLVRSLQDDISFSSFHARHRKEFLEWEAQDAKQLASELSADPVEQLTNVAKIHFENYVKQFEIQQKTSPENAKKWLFGELEKELKKVAHAVDLLIRVMNMIELYMPPTILDELLDDFFLFTRNFPSNMSVDTFLTSSKHLKNDKMFVWRLHTDFAYKLLKEKKYEQVCTLLKRGDAFIFLKSLKPFCEKHLQKEVNTTSYQNFLKVLENAIVSNAKKLNQRKSK